MAPTFFTYPIENISNSTTSNKLVALMQMVSDPNPAIRQPYDFLPGLLIVLVFAAIIFLGLRARGYSIVGCFAATSIANFIMVLLMYPLAIIPGWLLVVSIVLIPISAFILYAFSN